MKQAMSLLLIYCMSGYLCAGDKGVLPGPRSKGGVSACERTALSMPLNAHELQQHAPPCMLSPYDDMKTERCLNIYKRTKECASGACGVIFTCSGMYFYRRLTGHRLEDVPSMAPYDLACCAVGGIAYGLARCCRASAKHTEQEIQDRQTRRIDKRKAE